MVVTIFGDANARDGIQKSQIDKAAERWKRACQQMSHVPRFVVDWENDRPSLEEFPDAYFTTILITYQPQMPVQPLARPKKTPKTDAKPEAREEIVRVSADEVASWHYKDNTIQLLGKCGHKNLNIPCHTIRDSIDWNSVWGAVVITHELGHAMGLGHDPDKCKKHGIMKAILNEDDVLLPILPEYCPLVDDINNEHSKCNELPHAPDKHPCDLWPERKVPP